jgi:hypothetical protein
MEKEKYMVDYEKFELWILGLANNVYENFIKEFYGPFYWNHLLDRKILRYLTYPSNTWLDIVNDTFRHKFKNRVKRLKNEKKEKILNEKEKNLTSKFVAEFVFANIIKSIKPKFKSLASICA